MFSEDYPDGCDITSKEIEECASSNAIFILCISVGASAESIEFVHHDDLKAKLYIFFPNEFKKGFVYRSLFGTYGYIREDGLFSFKKFKNDSPELPNTILKRAEFCRFDVYRKLKMPS